MWAPRIPVSFGLYSSTAATKHPSTTDRHSSSAISSQPRRFRPPPRFSSSSSSSSPQHRASDEDIGGLGHAVLNALQSPSSSTDFSNSKTLSSAADLSNRDRNQSKQGERSIQQQRRQTHKEERELSGSEVLMALQKARARRSQSAKAAKKKAGLAVSGGSRGGGAAVPADYSNVRPLNIKSDWGVRLEELEKRLQEFLNV